MLAFLYTLIIYPLVQIIEFVFVFAQKLFKETGLSIICVSAAISVLCLPLYMVAETWQEAERKIQKRLAQKIGKIKAVFKGDEQYMILSTYYRQNHYHPVYALRSTFGLLIQIPFFIAAYSYLAHLEALQGAQFLFIHNLGAPDRLLPITIGGHNISLNMLPIIMTLVNAVSGTIYTKGLAVKDRIQLYGMALVFLVLLYHSPAGLVLYWTLNNVFSLLKNSYFKSNIPIKIKTTILYLLVSLVSFSLVFYVLVISHGVIRVRILVACILGIIGILPWLSPLIKKLGGTLSRIPYTLRECFILFLLCCAMLWVLTGFFIPSMLINASPQEFSFIDNYKNPLYFVYNTTVQSFGFFVFWPIMLFFLFSIKIKKIFTIMGLLTSCGALINLFIFPGNYGLISIDLILDNEVISDLKETAGNSLVLLALSCILIGIIFSGKKKIPIGIVSISLLALTGFSAINLLSINEEYHKLAVYHKPEQTTAQAVSPIFHLSKTGKNIVVIMLDRGTSVFIPYIFEESPELYEKYSGFTFYPNTVSLSMYTWCGSPPIFGGYEYTPLEINKRDSISITEKYNEALLMMPRLFVNEGFAVTVTDPPYAGGNWKPDLRIYDAYPGVASYNTDGVYTNLWLKEHNFSLLSLSSILKRNILWYAFLRVIPPAFRQSIYASGDWCAPVSGHALRKTLNGYTVLDYLSQLTDFVCQKENNLIVMVNNTTHEDSFLQAPNYEPVLNSTNYGTSPFSKVLAYHTNTAAIKRLADWFDFLKKEAVYDNTRIILVADHGPDSNFVTKTSLPFSVDSYNPLLMVKDFNASGPLKTDRVFMTNADVPSLTLEDIIDNPHNPFTGNKITMDLKKQALYVAIGRIHSKSATQLDLNPKRDYYVHDNLFDPANWSVTANQP